MPHEGGNRAQDEEQRKAQSGAGDEQFAVPSRVSQRGFGRWADESSERRKRYRGRRHYATAGYQAGRHGVDRRCAILMYCWPCDGRA